MLAICGNDALRELSSPGKSGSLFYLTQDDRFMIKTVKKSEVLLRMLPSYYQHVCQYKNTLVTRFYDQHVCQYKNTLVTRFYGVHCVKQVGGPKVRFVIMGNLLCSEYRIHKRFDLKGSRHGRTTTKVEGKLNGIVNSLKQRGLWITVFWSEFISVITAVAIRWAYRHLFFEYHLTNSFLPA
ncbi:hypothetical protein RND81_09G034300 [Saponaria officinalis]|uniref:1-phosphatidylinositol-4-phosphate 5-kinase n=1 Tax=Saponaria officinalis TaxID=3572 RepID=A0AAW1IHH8_SAPOF